MGATTASIAPVPLLGIDSVDVQIAENASYGLLQATQDAGLAQSFASTLEQELRQDLVTGGSGNTATVVVEAITIQSGVSRTVAAAESAVRGDVRVTDGAGREVARFEDVDFANKAGANQSTFNGIPIGALLSMARNSRDATPEQQIATLADGYSKTIAARFGR